MPTGDWLETPAWKLKILNNRAETSGCKVTEAVVRGTCCEAGGKWQSLTVASMLGGFGCGLLEYEAV
jgi:hypothetical protein